MDGIKIERANIGGVTLGRWPLVCLWLLTAAAVSAIAQPSGTSDVSTLLSGIASAGRLPDLRWPDFSDYREHVQNFYQPSNFTPAWVRTGKPTPQALAVIELLKQADRHGLDPEDYDGSRWGDRMARLQRPHAPSDEASIDAALTVSVMRYISDRHIGRVNPEHFKFGLSVQEKKYDLPAFFV
jgi:L,D-transpeptidase YcbB